MCHSHQSRYEVQLYFVRYYILLELFGTIGALVWTYLVSGVLIDLL